MGAGGIRSPGGAGSTALEKVVSLGPEYVMNLPRVTLAAFLFVALFLGGYTREGDVRSIRVKAEQGDVEAQVALAQVYLEGRGVQVDYVEAAKWYRTAAEQGDAAAPRPTSEPCVRTRPGCSAGWQCFRENDDGHG